MRRALIIASVLLLVGMSLAPTASAHCESDWKFRCDETNDYCKDPDEMTEAVNRLITHSVIHCT